MDWSLLRAIAMSNSSHYYQIALLNWKRSISNESDWKRVTWNASTPFGYYEVSVNSMLHKGCSEWSRSLRWTYCFDEYYDEDDFPCKSIREGKQKAEEHWRNRLLKCLIRKNE